MASPTSPYTSQAASGYNAAPPADDGSRVDSNKVEWAKHKDKLADPIKDLSDNINTQCVSAFNGIVMTTQAAEEAVMLEFRLFSP